MNKMFVIKRGRLKNLLDCEIKMPPRKKISTFQHFL
jgi:hypothetical protein